MKEFTLREKAQIVLACPDITDCSTCQIKTDPGRPCEYVGFVYAVVTDYLNLTGSDGITQQEREDFWEDK